MITKLIKAIARPFRQRRLRHVEAELVRHQEGLQFWRAAFDKSPDPILAMNLGYCRYRRDELAREAESIKGKM